MHLKKNKSTCINKLIVLYVCYSIIRNVLSCSMLHESQQQLFFCNVKYRSVGINCTYPRDREKRVLGMYLLRLSRRRFLSV